MFSTRDLDEAVGDILAGRPSPISCAKLANAARTASASSGRSCCAPKIFGKNSGMSFPTMTLRR